MVGRWRERGFSLITSGGFLREKLYSLFSNFVKNKVFWERPNSRSYHNRLFLIRSVPSLMLKRAIRKYMHNRNMGNIFCYYFQIQGNPEDRVHTCVAGWENHWFKIWLLVSPQFFFKLKILKRCTQIWLHCIEIYLFLPKFTSFRKGEKFFFYIYKTWRPNFNSLNILPLTRN